jgi:large subunit ribosomal protein L25
MEEIFLEIQPREETGKAKIKVLRRQGLIPAVVYSQGKKTEVIKVVSREFLRLIHQHRAGSVIINLKMKGEAKKLKDCACLIKEIQYDPVKGDVVHVDFNQISLTKALKVNVAVVTKGVAIGVKADGGVLEHILWEIEIECLPTEIPKEIEIDVTNLKIADAVHIRDIKVPPGVKILNDPGAIIVSVAPPAKEEIAVTPVEGEEKAEPEVIREKKETPSEEAEEAPKEKPKAKEEKQK